MDPTGTCTPRCALQPCAPLWGSGAGDYMCTPTWASAQSPFLEITAAYSHAGMINLCPSTWLQIFIHLPLFHLCFNIHPKQWHRRG